MTAERVPRRPRAGFTLIELMIVVVIIAILIAMLLPAIGGAMRNAREGQVKTELSQLDTACADFKAQFGLNPPSSIDFLLRTGGTGSINRAAGNLPPKTQAILRRLWPNIDMAGLTAELRKPANHPNQKELKGSGALLFFLGGVIPGKGEAPIGFATNPRVPIELSPPFATKRLGPFYEFRADRLYDENPATFDGYEGYLDSLPGQQLPIHYVTNEFYAAQEDFNNKATAANQDKMRPVYRQGASSFFNAQKVQLISPGQDGTTGENDSYPGRAYGVGGILNTQAGTLTETLDDDPAAAGYTHVLKDLARGDEDNITNFSSGRLVP